MRFILAFLLLLPMAAAAQSDDRGFIQGLLEDALSAEGRTVTIQGFEGALSSRATIERITVSDAQGVWLSAEDIALVWSRSALLRRRIEIDEISIGLLELPRLPAPADDESLPSPEAAEPFTLPELPVAVRLADLDIRRAEIGAPVLGEDAAFALEGSAMLEDGEGEVELAVERLDAPASLQLAGSFENATRALALNLELSEPDGGLVAERIGLPEDESLSLTLEGDGTLADFEAALSLQTGGEPRLTGTVTLEETEGGAQGFAVDVDGDLAPLLASEYRDFLGDRIALVASGARLPDGAITLDTLAVDAAALDLEGSARIGADGWPERFDLDAAITPVEGEDDVLLPLGGPQIRLAEAQLSAQYDRAESDTWQLTGTLQDFVRDSVEIGRVSLDGTGRIAPGDGGVTGMLDLETENLSLGNADLDQAIGTTLTGALAFAWQPGEPLTITDIDIGGSDYGVAGTVTVDGLEDQLGIRIAPNLVLNADQLSRFSPLVDLDLTGSAELAINGSVAPLTGAFDLNVRGTTQDVTTGIEQLDPLLEGEGVVEVNAVRNELGLQVAPLRIQTDAVRLEVAGDLGGGDGDLSLDLRLTETGDVIPGLTGVTTLSAEATQQPTGWDVSVSGDAPGQTILRYDGTVEPDTADGLFLSGTIEAAIGELSAFSQIADRPLSGAISFTATGNVTPQAPTFDIVAEAVSTDLEVGIAAADRLLQGRTEITFDAALGSDRTLVIDMLELDGANLSGSVEGRVTGDGGAVEMDLRLADIGVLAPQLSGPATLTGTAESDGGPWTVDIDADGPGGIAATIDGTIAPDTPQGPRFEGSIAANVDQLSAFSEVAGRTLGGSLSLSATGTVTPQGPAFDLQAEAVTTDLEVGIEAADRLLQGRTELTFDAALDEDGALVIDALQIDGDNLSGSVEGRITGDGGAVEMDLRLADIGVLAPQLSGPATLTGTAESDGGPWTVDIDADGPGGIAATIDGTIEPDTPQGPRFEGSIAANVDQLSAFSEVAGRSLGGSLSLSATGTVTPQGPAFDLQAEAVTTDLEVGIEAADRLLQGRTELAFDAALDEDGALVIDALQIDGDNLSGSVEGRITGDGGAVEMDLRLADIGVLAPQLSGPATLTGTAESDGGPWTVDIDADGPGGIAATIDGTIEPDTPQGPRFEGSIAANVDQLSAFSEVAGRTLGGSLSLSATGTVTPQGPAFDLQAEAVTTDLEVGIEAADRLLQGRTELAFDAALDEDGALVIDALQIDGDNLSGSVEARVTSDGGAVEMDLRLADIGVLAPQLSGPATLTGTAESDGGPWTVDIDADGPGGIAATIDGTIEPDTPQGPRFEGSIAANVDQLSAFSEVAGRTLGGSVTLSATGTVAPLAPTFDLEAELVTRDLSLGVTEADRLLRGRTEIAVDAELTEDGVLLIDTLRVDGQQITASVEGQVTPTDANLDIDARLADLGVLVPQFPGALEVSGTASSNGGPFRVDLDAQGPGGINAAVDGTVARDASQVNLSVNGNAPLALANPFISPRTLEGTAQFDLDINGPPALSSVSGTVTSADGQLSLPTLGLGLENIDATARLNGARAQVDLTAALSSGGTVAVQGPIGLNAPYDADLAIRLRNAELRDPGLYETEADARLTLTGPLAGGARIAGSVTLDEAELRIPQIGPSYEVLEGLRHVNPPADVVRTLQFAGLRPSGEPEREPSIGFPVDLLIEAPDRIFVRGRGLDAELGGQLRLTGTTNDLVPVGQFDLIRGRLDLLGQRLTLDEGSVSLRGSFDPVVNFIARADVDETEILIAITGMASSPELTVSSSPDLPQDEALALLLFGRDAGSLSALQALQLASAIRTLSGRGGVGLTDQLRSGLGVDDFDISTDAEGNAQARVGAYISENIYTDVTVGSDGDSAISLNLDVTDDVTVRGSTGADGDASIGIFFERDY